MILRPGSRDGSIPIVAALCLLLGLGCAASERVRLDYEPAEFRAALRQRVPGIPERLATVPFAVPDRLVERTRRKVEERPHGPPRVQALVDTLMQPEPNGLGLRYDWRASATAERTLELGQGNCLSLASVLVGLGRGLGWPVYYAEARAQDLEAEDMGSFRVLVDHIVVVVAAKTVRMVIDFTGLVDDRYQIRIIDDLTAYAHLINNIAAQRLIDAGTEASTDDWEAARSGFELSTRIQPDLGRTWNNLGLALSRLGHVEEARIAYARGVELDDGLGAAGRNLMILETRALGEPSVTRSAP